MSLRGTTWPVGVFGAPFAWGAYTGTTAGELLRVAYTGPTPTSSTLTLADGRVLAVTIAPGELSVLLPVDTPDGLATLTADEHTLEIPLHGVVIVPPPTPRAPGPGPRATPTHRVTSRSRVVLRSSSRPHPASTSRMAVRLRTTDTMRRIGAPPVRRVRGAVHLTAGSSSRVLSTRGVTGTIAVRSTARVTRRDGRGQEEALLLGLL